MNKIKCSMCRLEYDDDKDLKGLVMKHPDHDLFVCEKCVEDFFKYYKDDIQNI